MFCDPVAYAGNCLEKIFFCTQIRIIVDVFVDNGFELLEFCLQVND